MGSFAGTLGDREYNAVPPGEWVWYHARQGRVAAPLASDPAPFNDVQHSPRLAGQDGKHHEIDEIGGTRIDALVGGTRHHGG